MNFKIEGKIIPFVFTLIILSLFTISMWDHAVQYSNDRMPQISVYLDASNWIINNLQDEETVILPIHDVFLVANPTLNQQIKSYKSFWEDAAVDVIHATNEEKNIVRQNFWNYTYSDTNKAKYVVLALNDKYMAAIFDITPKELPALEVCNNINSKLSEAKRFNFEIPSSGWKNSLVICEVQ